MFGFLRPHRSSNSFRSYRQAYARCCQFQRQCFGIDATLALSYEAVFLYLLGVDSAVCSGPASDSATCCRLRSMGDATTADDSQLGRYCSAFGMLLAQVKLDDDDRDGASLLSRVARIRLRRRFGIAREILTQFDAELLPRVQQAIAEHLEIEASAAPIRIDEYAIPTGVAFSAVFASVPGDLSDRERQRLGEIGRHIGHAIIAFDCAVDFQRDQDRGEFNPLGKSDVDFALHYSAEEISRAGWLCQESAQSQLTADHLRTVFDHVQAHRSVNQDKAVSCCEPKRRPNRQENARPGYLLRHARAGICDCDCVGDLCCSSDLCAGDVCTGDVCSASCSGSDLCCCDCGNNGKRKKKKKRKKRTKSENRAPDSPEPMRELVGSTALATGDLMPTGVIEVDGVEHPAKSEAGFVERGQRVKIVRREAFGFIVRPA